MIAEMQGLHLRVRPSPNASLIYQSIIQESAPFRIDSANYVYVLQANRVQKFTSDGKFMGKWGNRGAGDNQLNGPLGIAVDATGNVYITEHSSNCVQKFGPDGRFLGKWGAKGEEDGQFNGSRGLMVDGAGSVYVADFFNHRVQKFAVR